MPKKKVRSEGLAKGHAGSGRRLAAYLNVMMKSVSINSERPRRFRRVVHHRRRRNRNATSKQLKKEISASSSGGAA